MTNLKHPFNYSEYPNVEPLNVKKLKAILEKKGLTLYFDYKDPRFIEATIIREASKLVPVSKSTKKSEKTLSHNIIAIPKTKWDYLTHFISEVFPFFKRNFSNFVSYSIHEASVTQVNYHDVEIQREFVPADQKIIHFYDPS